MEEGIRDGTNDGLLLGSIDGIIEGIDDGRLLGTRDGIVDGTYDGVLLCIDEGNCDDDGRLLGIDRHWTASVQVTK